MNLYSQIKSFQFDCWIQVYKYAFLYVYPKTMLEEDCFTATQECLKLQENINFNTSIKTLAWIWLHMFRRL